MENLDEKSGEWVGYYCYGADSAKHTMELSLQFQGSKISGHGIDDVARFTIDGEMVGDSCSWVKSYDTHSVEYVGFMEGGRIWGTWRIAFTTGGFMIWPRGKSGPDEQEKHPEMMPLESLAGK